MRFALSGVRGGLEAHGPAPTLDLARWAEDLGFAGLWFNEEHFGRDRQGRLTEPLSPLLLATAVAAVTTHIRVGFSVLLLPLHHPLRLAEELATLDVLSGGRVDAGLAGSANPRYAAALADNWMQVPSLHDAVGTMVAHWTGTPVDTGEDEPREFTPRPVQQPHPPIYIGGYHDETIAWAARSGHATVQHGIQSPASLQRTLAVYADNGGDVTRVPVGRFCYVGETDEQAWAEAGHIVDAQSETLRSFGIWRRGELITTLDDLDTQRFRHETAIVGSPETVATRLAALRDELGVRQVNLLSSFFGLLPQDLLRRSLRLFADEVMPTLA